MSVQLHMSKFVHAYNPITSTLRAYTAPPCCALVKLIFNFQDQMLLLKLEMVLIDHHSKLADLAVMFHQQADQVSHQTFLAGIMGGQTKK